jgi:hypothetical protein
MKRYERPGRVGCVTDRLTFELGTSTTSRCCRSPLQEGQVEPRDWEAFTSAKEGSKGKIGIGAGE